MTDSEPRWIGPKVLVGWANGPPSPLRKHRSWAELAPLRRIPAGPAAILGCGRHRRVLGWAGGGLKHPKLTLHLPWPALAARFAASVVLRIHLQVRRQVHAFTVMEVPLVLGLHVVDPASLVLARLAGSVPALVLHARQRAHRLLFNLAHFALEACVPPWPTPGSWLAAPRPAPSNWLPLRGGANPGHRGDLAPRGHARSCRDQADASQRGRRGGLQHQPGPHRRGRPGRRPPGRLAPPGPGRGAIHRRPGLCVAARAGRAARTPAPVHPGPCRSERSGAVAATILAKTQQHLRAGRAELILLPDGRGPLRIALDRDGHPKTGPATDARAILEALKRVVATEQVILLSPPITEQALREALRGRASPTPWSHCCRQEPGWPGPCWSPTASATWVPSVNRISLCSRR
jgi:hypothetical protein